MAAKKKTARKSATSKLKGVRGKRSTRNRPDAYQPSRDPKRFKRQAGSGQRKVIDEKTKRWAVKQLLSKAMNGYEIGEKIGTYPALVYHWAQNPDLGGRKGGLTGKASDHARGTAKRKATKKAARKSAATSRKKAARKSDSANEPVSNRARR